MLVVPGCAASHGWKFDRSKSPATIGAMGGAMVRAASAFQSIVRSAAWVLTSRASAPPHPSRMNSLGWRNSEMSERNMWGTCFGKWTIPLMISRQTFSSLAA
eukprot:scaffold279435_cov33-Tisochrysis_lutea.AAC.2